MILANGTLLPDSHLPQLFSRLEQALNETRGAPGLKVETVLDALDRLVCLLDAGALDGLIAQYAPPGAREALDRARPLLTRDALEYKIHTELGPSGLSPRSRPFGHTRPMPLGVLLHVAPGNMPGLPVFSVVEGLLTGNINLLKLPRSDRGLSLAVLKQLVDTEPRLAPYIYAFDLPSGDAASLRTLARLANGLAVWGGDEAVAACRDLAPPGCRLIEWGHRLSFAYLSGSPDPTELDDLARHIVHTGGLLCSSCQVIFLDTNSLQEAQAFCLEFLSRLERASAARSPGDAAQSALYAQEAFLEHIVDRAGTAGQFFRGAGCSITLGQDRELELSPLHGNVLVKCLPRTQLLPVLGRQTGRLQTAGLICPPGERGALTALLARAGVTRITRANHMSSSFSGEGHDGEYPLRRYLRMVDVEA